MDNKLNLAEICKDVRRDIVTMISKAGSGHPGGSLSSVEIMVTLYYKVMHVDAKNPHDPKRDRFILSKGHIAPALYSVLARKGYFDMAAYAAYNEGKMTDYIPTDEDLEPGFASLPKIPGIQE